MALELASDVEAQAQGFFLSNYAAEQTPGPQTQFEWLPQLLSQSNVDETLNSSVQAVSLACMGYAVKSSMVMRKARIAYIAALERINRALQSTDTATKDSTLVSVILLGMYESTVYTGKNSDALWSKHVNGACTLFKLRGKRQFQSEVGLQIFLQFYSFAMLAALHTDTSVHESMWGLHRSCPTGATYSALGRAFTLKIVKITHDIVNINKDNSSDPVSMVIKAMSIDKEMDEIKEDMPDIWHFETQHLTEPVRYHHGSVYTIFSYTCLVHPWNYIRMFRLQLHNIIRANITKGFEEYATSLFDAETMRLQMQYSDNVQRAQVAAIVASVPQLVGMVPFPESSAPRTATPVSSLHAPGTHLSRSITPGLMHLITPLHSAATYDFVTYDMRQWIIEVLQFIALRIGSSKATVLAEDLLRLQGAAERSQTNNQETSNWIMPLM